MRILLIGDLASYRLGGAESKLEKIAVYLAAHGHELTIAGRYMPDGQIDLRGLPVRSVSLAIRPSRFRILRGARFAFVLGVMLMRQARRQDCAYTLFLGEAAIVASVLKAFRLIALPLMACPAGAGGSSDCTFLRSVPAWRLWRAMLRNHVDRIQILTPGIQEELLRFGMDAGRFAHIPNPVELPPLRSKKQPSESVSFIYTGRLSQEKGVDVLLLALRQVRESGLDFRLKIVGDGPDGGPLKRQAEGLGLDRQVQFLGQRSISEVENQLAKADVFVLPSRQEGLSNAALEALASQLPVIVTRCQGIDTYVDASIGWVCRPDDVVSLADALMHALTISVAERHAMGDKARDLAETQFAIDIVGARLEAALRSVAGA